jgi:hypothetical protein
MIKLLLNIFIFIFISTNTWASYPEMFGASYSTSMIGNQSNLDPNDPSNNYYVPAVLAFTQKVNVLMQATSTATNFEPIKNVVVANSTNSSNTTTNTTSGNVSTDYLKFYGSSLHFGLPIGYPEKGVIGTLGLSIYLPIGSIIETNSGNPFLPEYVMYHTRHQRTSIYLNFAHKQSENFAWSVGSILGFQASADVSTNLDLNGGSTGSWASAKTKVAPSIGAVLSGAFKFDHSTIYLTFQQEMKSNLDAHVTGTIINPNLGLFDANIKSLIFYDPHTIRLGGSFNFGDFDFISAIEYQLWSGYKTPRIDIIKNGGTVTGSKNYETISTKDTINPRIGGRYHITDRVSLALGASYRKSPIVNNLNESGNTIDTDAYILTGGFSYRIVIWSKDVTIGASLEYHQLQDKTVTKTANQENGNAGVKLGSPGYQIGGSILSSAAGIKFNF